MLALMIGIAMAAGVFWYLRRDRIEVDENGISHVPNDDRGMAKASAQARASVQTFLGRLKDPRPGDESFAIKVAIRHEGQTENLWLTDVETDEAGFRGFIGNDPQMVPQRMGDAWRGDWAELIDWSYMSNGRMQGNFTLRAMLPRLPKDQRMKARIMLESRWDLHELIHLPSPPDAVMPGQPLSDAISHGDSVLMDAVGTHMETHLGVHNVFHEIVSPSAHIDLYPRPATATRPFHVVVTSGMAEKAMQLPQGSTADPWVELMVLLPPTWPLDAKAWKTDDTMFWPLSWLKRIARYPYESGRWLGEGHVLVNGAPPLPIETGFKYDGVLLAAPRRMPPGFETVALKDGRRVRFLCLYFLDRAARETIEAIGWQAYVDQMPPERLSL